MMLKITERCTMGCSHCLNNALPDGKDMTHSILKDSLKFIKENNLAQEILLVTGGEPTEHPEYDFFMNEILNEGKGYFKTITVTTNGEEIIKNPDRFHGYIAKAEQNGIMLLFQVSADTRFYPRRIPVHKRILREKGFVLCDGCVTRVYPQGRALANNLPWQAKASKCFNIRALSHQLPEYITLKDLEVQLMMRGFHCTPHIGIDGAIKLGESDLCPSCATIYDSMNEIMQKIRSFQCSQCDHINQHLPQQYKRLL